MIENGQQHISGQPEARTANRGLAKVAVQCPADTFVMKIATFTKPETASSNVPQYFFIDEN